MAPTPVPVAEPFPISHISNRYLLFDVDVISHCRRNHNITGVLIGTIPNLSQQNVFLGVPLELMPEEARVLMEKGHAYIIDDVERHRKGFMEMSREDRLKWLEEMDRKGAELARESMAKAEGRKERVLKEKGLGKLLNKGSFEAGEGDSTVSGETLRAEDSSAASTSTTKEALLFDSTPPHSSVPSVKPIPPNQRQYITPATSHPPLPTPDPSLSLPLPTVPKSYPLFRYLHYKGYFQMPGLRFGCHYNVYPGDPLRFHSHFLGTGMDWDEEFDLLDIVGGGRLGTGVKKAYLIGGEDPSIQEGEEQDSVRAFSIEWAGL